MLDNTALKKKARAAITVDPAPPIAVFLVFSAIQATLSGLSFWGGSIFLIIPLLMPPLIIGMSNFYLELIDGLEPKFSRLFSGFDVYIQSLVVMLLSWLFTFLWSLLLIVPGIIKALSYSMARYIASEVPEMDGREAIKLSIRMTDGRKSELFMFYLSFIGWLLLSALTFGILYVLYVGPYMEIAKANVYQELKRDALLRGVLSERDFRQVR